MKSRIHFIAVAFACLLWSGSIIATKLSYSSMSPMSLGFIRFSLSAILLFILLVPKHKQEVKARPKDYFLMAISGLIGTTLYFAAENYGAMLLPASTSSLIVAAFPALTLMMESLIKRELPSISKSAGILIAFLGVALIAFTESSNGGHNVLAGALILIFGGLCWGIFSIMMGPIVELGHSTLWVTSWQTLFGALGFIPLVLMEGLPTELPDTPSLISLAYLVIACTVLGFVLYNFGLKELSASTAVSLANLIPVFGLILSALILHENIYPLQIIGGALVICGIFFSSREQTREAAIESA